MTGVEGALTNATPTVGPTACARRVDLNCFEWTGAIAGASHPPIGGYLTSSNLVGCTTGCRPAFVPRRSLSRPGRNHDRPVAPADGYLPTAGGSNSCATLSYQILKRGSPVLEIASAIQAFALALSAIRSARNGALSLRPPALMY